MSYSLDTIAKQEAQAAASQTGSRPKTKAVLNQAVADLSKAYSIVHQVHWYMRGRGFLHQNSNLTEEKGTWDKSMEDHLSRLVEVYSYLDKLYQVGLDVTDEEGDDPSNDIFTAAQADVEKTLWMLQAELGQAPGLD